MFCCTLQLFVAKNKIYYGGIFQKWKKEKKTQEKTI